MNERINKRREKERKKSLLYILSGVLILTIIIISLLAVFLLKNDEDNRKLDKLTLCPKSGPVAHTVLLIDKTDPLNFTQKQAFQRLIENIVENQIEKGELISIFALGEDFQKNEQAVLEICNPGDGSDKSEWTSNINRLNKQYKEKFYKPILEISNELVDVKEGKYSPIMEQIQMVSINGFKKHRIDGKKRLIILSDMLQNTEQFSMYKGYKSYEDFSRLDYSSRIIADLLNVRIELNYILNSPKLQTKKHLLFWEKYFEKMGGKIVAVKILEG